MKSLITWASENPALFGIYTFVGVVIIAGLAKALMGPSKPPVITRTLNPNPPVGPINGVDVIFRTARVPSGTGGGMSGGRVRSGKS